MTENTNHLQSRVEKAHERIDSVDLRVTRLERNEAVSAVRMTVIQSSLTKIETILGRIVWLILAAILTAAMGFVLKGGFGGL